MDVVLGFTELAKAVGVWIGVEGCAGWLGYDSFPLVRSIVAGHKARVADLLVDLVE